MDHCHLLSNWPEKDIQLACSGLLLKALSDRQHGILREKASAGSNLGSKTLPTRTMRERLTTMIASTLKSRCSCALATTLFRIPYVNNSSLACWMVLTSRGAAMTGS